MAMLLNWRIWAILAVVAALGTIAYKIDAYGYNRGVASNIAIVTTLNAKLAQNDALYQQELLDNSKLQQEWLSKYQEAEDHANVIVQANKAASIAASSNVDSLRESLNSARTKLSNDKPTQSATIDYATAIGALFADCSGKYQDMAEKADGHAVDAERLEASWPQEKAPN